MMEAEKRLAMKCGSRQADGIREEQVIVSRAGNMRQTKGLVRLTYDQNVHTGNRGRREDEATMTLFGTLQV